MFGKHVAIGGCDDPHVVAVAHGVEPRLQQVAGLRRHQPCIRGLPIHERVVDARDGNGDRTTRKRHDKWMKEWPLDRRGNGHIPSVRAQ